MLALLHALAHAVEDPRAVAERWAPVIHPDLTDDLGGGAALRRGDRLTAVDFDGNLDHGRRRLAGRGHRGAAARRPTAPCMRRLVLPVALLAPAVATAADLVVAPFVQDVEPTSAWVVWEVDANVPATVTFHVDGGRDVTVEATSRATGDGTWIQEARLDGLPPGGRVRYVVHAGDAASTEADLLTPPERADDGTFTLVAMSDMQRTESAPDKWAEVVQDGVLAWSRQQWGDDVAAAFGAVLLPGDLVEVGPEHDRWIDEFFAPVAPLAAHVPIYPVLGNHELNAHWYFDYFHLPDDGTATLPEQWWSKRVRNVLILGLDTNLVLRWTDQVAWLDARLAEACADDAVDFVFAEVHHPFRSELWVAGESPLTGQLADRLEAFSIDCGKPSVHFFGHTHAYARGQRRDGTHLMVNVATAGGAIDRWGAEFQRDYDEFSVATDDWGFVVVEVSGGDDPRLRLRRMSRGDAEVTLDNPVTDDLEIRRHAEPPAAPTPLVPFEAGDGACVALRAGPFVDPDAQAHQATHWQVAASCDGFDQPVRDLWRQDRDLFMDVDGRVGDDLTDEVVRGLPEGAWCWRVRYRDAGLAWSPWSEPVAFRTSAPSRTANLLPSPGGEDDLDGWLIDAGNVEVTGAARCGAALPVEGSRALAIGGLCAPALPATLRGTVDVDLAVLGTSAPVVHLGLHRLGAGLLARVRFLDGLGAELDAWEEALPAVDAWGRVDREVPVPAGVAKVELTLTASDAAVQVDDVELSVGAAGELDCSPRPLLAPSPDPVTPETACGGCATGGGGWAALAVVGALAGTRRRRAR